jgi:hypothetical protein
MAPLDPDRVRLFAAAKGAPNLDAFLEQIEAANLWRFPLRPLDLDWLVEFWESRGRLGSLAEMLENSLGSRRSSSIRRARASSSGSPGQAAPSALHEAVERRRQAFSFGHADRSSDS